MKKLSFKLSQVFFLIFLLGTIANAFTSHSVSKQTQQITWGTQAVNLRGRNGQQFTYFCPGNGTISGSLWGTDFYTDDSSICTAAVHAGLISTQSGGMVTIEIRAGASSYQGSSRYGVTSKSYGSWHGSFVFVGGRSATGNTGAAEITWATQADGWRGQNGQRYTLHCPSGGTISSRLWGTGFYTDDSSICTAAVHAGLINTSGGVVTIEIRGGANSYQGSTRNGVTSKNYGSWNGSFVFVGAAQTQQTVPGQIRFNFSGYGNPQRPFPGYVGPFQLGQVSISGSGVVSSSDGALLSGGRIFHSDNLRDNNYPNHNTIWEVVRATGFQSTGGVTVLRLQVRVISSNYTNICPVGTLGVLDLIDDNRLLANNQTSDGIRTEMPNPWSLAPDGGAACRTHIHGMNNTDVTWTDPPFGGPPRGGLWAVVDIVVENR